MTDQTTAAAPAAGETSMWLQNAKSAIESAIQYVEEHFRALEAKLEGTKTASAATDPSPAAAPSTAS
jgi:hypothetical protein